jgi:ribosome assembly protein YihI (activator of Der GTPase)
VTKAQGRELLAQRVIDGCAVISATLKSLEPDIRKLWVEFDKLASGETIHGCKTKKQFSDRHLGRTPRTIRYMLAGGNPGNKKTREIISPALDVFDAAYQYLSAFSSEGNLGRLPALLDRLKVGPTLTAEEQKTLKAVLTQLEHLSEQAGAYRQQLSEYAPKAEAA